LEVPAHHRDQDAGAAAANRSATDTPLSSEGVYREHVEFVWRALRRLGVREADVEDVCHEVFLVVHRRIRDYDFTSTVQTWLYGIAIRTASDYRRRAHIRREAIGTTLPEPVVAPSQSEGLEQRDARAMLDALLDQLDDDKREVFVLYEMEQLPMAEVAAVVNCAVPTAYSRLQAARKQLSAAARRLHTRTGGLR
jgi:RNA polymerase sigma-70 factor (ECF subfamily)